MMQKETTLRCIHCPHSCHTNWCIWWVVSQVQAKVVPLGQLQVLEDSIQQHLAIIRLLQRTKENTVIHADLYLLPTYNDRQKLYTRSPWFTFLETGFMWESLMLTGLKKQNKKQKLPICTQASTRLQDKHRFQAKWWAGLVYRWFLIRIKEERGDFSLNTESTESQLKGCKMWEITYQTHHHFLRKRRGWEEKPRDHKWGRKSHLICCNFKRRRRRRQGTNVWLHQRSHGRTHTHTPLCPADTVLQRTVCVCGANRQC